MTSNSFFNPTQNGCMVWVFLSSGVPWLRYSLLLRCVCGSYGCNLLSVGQQWCIGGLCGRNIKNVKEDREASTSLPIMHVQCVSVPCGPSIRGPFSIQQNISTGALCKRTPAGQQEHRHIYHSGCSFHLTDYITA